LHTDFAPQPRLYERHPVCLNSRVPDKAMSAARIDLDAKARLARRRA
jgi:hypothetical protein